VEQLKERSQQLNDSNEKLQAKNTKLDSLLHIITHHLKTLIAALRASIEMIERRLSTQLQEKDLQLLAIPRRSVDRLNEMVQQLGNTKFDYQCGKIPPSGQTASNSHICPDAK
jgi:signal transduction histidine kinase